MPGEVCNFRRRCAPPFFAYLTGHEFDTFMPKIKSQVTFGQELLRSNRGHVRANLTEKRANFEVLPKLEFSTDLQVSFVNRQRIDGATKWLSRIFKILVLSKNIFKKVKFFENFGFFPRFLKFSKNRNIYDRPLCGAPACQISSPQLYYFLLESFQSSNETYLFLALTYFDLVFDQS